MYKFEIAETKEFQKNLKRLDTKLYEKIKNIVYPQLCSNPFFGTNIKKLKGELEGELEGVYRYRIGNYRVFYVIENEKVLVVMTSVSHRQGAYE